MKKPSKRAIENATPLSVGRPADPLSACNVCGKASKHLTAWREHDVSDAPVGGIDALVFVGSDHVMCHQKLQDHPRLYVQERGEPGHLSAVCPDCVHRDGTSCRSPKAMANGGSGIRISMGGFGGLVCARMSGGRGGPPFQEAVGCSGHEPRLA